MIVAPTSCYFVIKTGGEAAGHMVSEISPLVGADIISAVLTSTDFESDIQAAQLMDMATGRIIEHTSADTPETLIKYNPLYVPGSIELVDDMLCLEPRHDGIRFTGMGGNPFLFKTVEIKNNGEQLLVGKVEYRPFDIPSYSEIVVAHSCQLN